VADPWQFSANVACSPFRAGTQLGSILFYLGSYPLLIFLDLLLMFLALLGLIFIYLTLIFVYLTFPDPLSSDPYC
jgi:hypothetical protein